MNKTQCPYCFTVYVISDEQMLAPEGMVRCGTCRERFQAQLMTPEGVQQFDSTQAFIEPLSDVMPTDKLSPEDFIEDPTGLEFTEITSSPSLGSVPPVFSIKNYDFSDSLSSELSIEINDEGELTDPDEIARREKAIQQELNLPRKHQEPETTIEQPSSDEAELIDQDDSLVQNKLIDTAPDSGDNDSPISTPESPQYQDDELPYNELLSDQSSSGNRLGSWLGGLALILLGFGLTSSLIYQLWLKQTISWPDDARVQSALQPLVGPLKQKLDEAGLAVPTRRNLSQLELLSARTEAHPTRPSTILLKVSLMNRAQIEQPLPWLELSLTDADGRLVSRRSLSPNDYVFNNRIDNTIGAKQVKKVTIELLAFPEQATGYELKLLNI
ncbi:MAG: putative Zn finger-like uncharacterized protein [Cryomorphaceae bacterium]|jgi:predicted Zn finger-like uncharacterized protein